MKKLFLSIAAAALVACGGNAPKALAPVEGTVQYDKAYDCDTYTTANGREVSITFIKHGTLMLDIAGSTVHIDPVAMFGTDYAAMPKADLVLVSHEHGDHLDSAAVAAVTKENTVVLTSAAVAEKIGSQPLAIGETVDMGGYTVTGVHAYNCSPGHENFHPKGHGLGFVFDVDDLRIYVAGDTEDIPELAELKDIDIAFLPVNQPFTMTPEQCIHAAEMLKPRVLIPYHYGETDLSPIVDHFKDNPATEVYIRQLQ
mgnify:CR=1 FL=1